jgi:hypothetical protein
MAEEEFASDEKAEYGVTEELQSLVIRESATHLVGTGTVGQSLLQQAAIAKTVSDSVLQATIWTILIN